MLELANLFVQLVGIVAWPTVAVISICLFKKPVVRILDRIKNISYEGGKFKSELSDVNYGLTEQANIIVSENKDVKKEKLKEKMSLLTKFFKTDRNRLSSLLLSRSSMQNDSSTPPSPLYLLTLSTLALEAKVTAVVEALNSKTGGKTFCSSSVFENLLLLKEAEIIGEDLYVLLQSLFEIRGKILYGLHKEIDPETARNIAQKTVVIGNYLQEIADNILSAEQ